MFVYYNPGRRPGSGSGCLWLALALLLFAGSPLIWLFFGLILFALPALFGLIIALFFGRAFLNQNRIQSYLARDSETHKNFVELLIGILAKIATADGSMDQAEVRAIREFFQYELRYTKAQLLWTRDVLKSALNAPVTLEELCEAFSRQYGYEEKLILLLLLYRVAFADGRLTAAEEALLNRVVALLGIQAADHKSIRSRFTKEDEMTQAYAVLGLAQGASAGEVKQAYRELSKKYHPDRAQHLGLEFRKVAEEKMKEINEAYTRISKLTGGHARAGGYPGT